MLASIQIPPIHRRYRIRSFHKRHIKIGHRSNKIGVLLSLEYGMEGTTQVRMARMGVCGDPRQPAECRAAVMSIYD